MKLSKENIISLFENSKFRNFTITNVVIFDKDVIIDISINNPTLQARKKIESSITGLISQKFEEKIKLVECLYAVDIDYNAVAATKFALCVKLLEDETKDTVVGVNPILPSLKVKIKCGK